MSDLEVLDPEYYTVWDMEKVDWQSDLELHRLRGFIREGELFNNSIITPSNIGFHLPHTFRKHDEYKIRHLGEKVQFNAINGEIIMGQEAYFGSHCVIYAAGSEIIIGERIKMSPFSSIYASHHDSYDREKIVGAPVTIGDNVWIGEGAKVMRGVTLANNCVVGANAVVTKSFLEPYSVIGGAPAKLLRIARSD